METREQGGTPYGYRLSARSGSGAFGSRLWQDVAGANVNYRHAVHAGNSGDVLKHLVLIALLEHLTRADGPVFFLDTHAGRGRYDLDAPALTRGRKTSGGIRQLAARSGLPPLVQRYLELVQQFDAANAGRIRHYPGSPWIAAMMLRPRDRAALCELEPTEAQALEGEFDTDARITVHQGDGYAALGQLLPPRETRGLVLLDPPYESLRQDVRAVSEALACTRRRWPQGICAAWYPVTRAAPGEALRRALASGTQGSLLCAELSIPPPGGGAGLAGSGMMIANPPGRLDEELAAVLPAIHMALAKGGSGGAQVHRLRPGG